MFVFRPLHESLTPSEAAWMMFAGIALFGIVDFVTGVEVRIYPLYFVPLSIGAWALGRRAAWIGSLFASAAWYESNVLAGLHYSSPVIWVVNFVAQAAAFLTVSLLIAQMRQMLEREKRLSRTDSLTGLANSRAFSEAVGNIAPILRRQRRPLAIAYLDLDNFKCVNDRLGHARGDDVLRAVAAAIGRTLRRSDVAARIGGDEFVVCLPDADAAAANVVLERLRLAVLADVDVPPCQVSASIGAVAWTVPPEDVAAMLQGADELMYEVKRSGKDRVHVIARDAG